MQGIAKRISALAVAGVLLFWCAFPVPSGLDAIDRVRYEKAEAVAVAAIPAFITLCGLVGITVSTYAGMDWGAACSDLYDAWIDFTESDETTQAARILSCVNSDGYIDTTRLDSNFVYDLAGFAGALVDGGNAIFGQDSASAISHGIYFGDYFFPGQSEPPDGFELLSKEWTDCVGYYLTINDDGSYTYRYLFNLEGVGKREADPGVIVTATGRNYYVRIHNGNKTKSSDNQRYSIYSWQDGNYINTAYPWPATVSGYSLTAGVHADKLAVVPASLYSGVAEISDGVYQVFNPTDAQIEQGYSTADILEAVNAGNEIAGDISGTVSQVLSSVQQIVQLIGSVNVGVGAMSATVTGMAAAPFPWLEAYFDDVLEWMGYEGFEAGIADVTGELQSSTQTLNDSLIDVGGAVSTVGNAVANYGTGIRSDLSDLILNTQDLPTWQDLSGVMGTVISGVQAIPGAIGGAVDDLLGGVADIPHVLEGLLEGVLDGVLSIPDAIALAASGVLEGIADLAGTVEGIMNPFYGSGFDFSGGSVALPSGSQNHFEAALREKVPFCYLIRSQDAISSMFGNFGAGRSFYFDLDVPKTFDLQGQAVTTSLHFDAEPVLSIGFGALDIATTVKVLATGLLCLGLLYRAYKIIERMAL